MASLLALYTSQLSVSIPYLFQKVNDLFDFIKFVGLFALIDSAKALRYIGTVQEVEDGTNKLEPAVFRKYTRENHYLAAQIQPHRRRTGTSA
jgi:hypothetical protein